MRRRGFTLTELIIAMAISAIVLAMVVGVYRRQQRSFALQNEVTERQQNVRVAMDAIVRDLRLAGHGTSLMTTPTLDYTGDGTPDSLILAAVDNSQGVAGIADGTDVVTIVYARLPHQFSSVTNEFAQGTSVSLASLDLDGDGQPDFAAAGAAIPMCYGILYDFSRATAFQVTAVAGTTLTINPAVPSEYAAGAYVSPLSIVKYWIDNKTDAVAAAFPRLMREDFGRDTGPEIVAENVTDLQVQYGLDPNKTGAVTSWVNDFSAATSLPQNVLAVRVWVMGRNPTPRPGYVDQLQVTPAIASQVNALQYGNVNLAPAALYVRELLMSEVELRNHR